MNLQVLTVRPRKDNTIDITPSLENDKIKTTLDNKLYHFTSKQNKDEQKYYLDENRIETNQLFGLKDIDNYDDNDDKMSMKFKPNPDFMISYNNNENKNKKISKELHKSNSNQTFNSNNNDSQKSKENLYYHVSSKENKNVTNSMQIFDEYMDELNRKKKGEYIHRNNNHHYEEDQPVKVALNIIQSKYHKNLEVINSLHDEKTMMQMKMRSLENENRMLRRQAGINDYDDYYEYDDDYVHHDSNYHSNNDNHNQCYGNDDFEYPIKNDEKRMTAMELALLLESDDTLNNSHSNITRPQSMTRPKITTEVNNNHSSPRVGMTKTLLAAQDKFIQRRRASDIAERKKQVQDAILDKEYRDKVYYASLRGKAPEGIFQRQKAAQDKLLNKQQKREQNEKAEKDKQLELKRRQVEADEEYRNDPKNHFTWQELCDIEEGKRKDRIERRKHELASFARAPKCATTSSKKQESNTNYNADKEKTFEFIAEDPDLVAIRLQRERAEWEDHVEKTRKKAIKKLEADRINTIDPVTGLNRFTSAMETRQEQYERRRSEKLEKDKIQKELQREKERRKDEMRTYKLLNNPPPPTKITKSVEIMINETRKKMDEHERKTTIEIETGIHNNNTNKSNYLIEVQEALELKSKDAAAAFIEQSRINMIKNKKQIKIAVQKRPSLLERHRIQLEQEKAVDRAISKINGIIKDSLSTSEVAEEKYKSDNFNKYDKKYDSDDDKEYK